MQVKALIFSKKGRIIMIKKPENNKVAETFEIVELAIDNIEALAASFNDIADLCEYASCSEVNLEEEDVTDEMEKELQMTI